MTADSARGPAGIASNGDPLFIESQKIVENNQFVSRKFYSKAGF
jgi:hypothetical protein